VVTTGNIVKMSKSKKNVIDPQDLIDAYGADTVRMFCLFAAPPEKGLEWSDQGVEGVSRFLGRVWRLVTDNLTEIRAVANYDGKVTIQGKMSDLNRKTHQTIKKVTNDIETRFHFNTAISATMELINEITQFVKTKDKKDDLAWSVIREATEATVILLSPVVPHITEELWHLLGNNANLLDVAWPEYRESALKAQTRLIVVQVNGKVRSKIEVPASHDKDKIEAEALADERVQKFIEGKKIKKVIVVQQKLVNVVV
jgi:leucyl-tRNA synthetase